ncbi:Nucleotidyltransferase/DNA polymerase involved in DNA repair [Treponema bryantii]|uniref:DNA polymerase IV n=1 Tax=Treponema bryantii TaxID=163 RepID=A0A1I3IR35_9SPIR|nr:DNA polymerase IV [Treponema bryantii]SFI50421.1 Nucleotidyltransferase/DNA polymerase involved in DNA repair [Treponema bryantii]
MDKITHWYLHVDLDAFFASVEQLDNPDLRGKPVIVGGKPEDRRSVVSTASYEARAFGVHSAMPTFQAYKLCPQGIFVHGRMHRYAELSHQIMNIFRDYSPDVDQMSIDEAFIDLTGTEKLFGPPEETARAIKARVKKETGLTVSVGLATTKYLAKICSGLSKPDGFYQIKAGTEETFMLNLPLNKVWGLGPKSLELIKKKGFNSTRDIYEKDYDTLEFLFGKNMATFLYNVVRGIEKESFSRESKTHSISAETTFPFDLTDIYTIETELLELAHGVFFRLLKEESFSRTAFVKIRYEDFSTSTVQETVERNIITLDSYFEIIKRLFEKRYENGRGIRLLGLGFENVVKEEKPYQQELFSTNNDEKKQAVEKAILNLSKKHPEIKVSKARTLKAVLFAALIGWAPAQLKAQENTLPPSEDEEPPVYLFDYDINDKNHVDFSASGLWKMEFTSGVDITFGNYTETAASPTLPVFKQETDISALLTLNRHWYFEAAFADEFTRNTFAFGYKGEGLVRHFRMANRGITMAEGYSAEHFGYALRGGSNQAPGLSLQLVSPSEKIQADFLVRYDMTETKSEIYYGMNKVSDIKIRAEDFAYGREFHFPQEASQRFSEINAVYVEDSAGSYTDARSRKYRKLRSDEYAVVKSTATASAEPRLFIAREAGGGKTSSGDIPSILVTFNFPQGAAQVITAAGAWNNDTTFLGKIQKELGVDGKYNINEYSYELLTTLEGEPALIIQNYEGFSPFLCPSVYDVGSKKEADYLVIADESEMPVSKYKAFEADETYTQLYENFFATNQNYVRISNTEYTQSVYPFAQDCPEIYLGHPQKTDLAIRARTYSPVTELIVSKKAAAGTVQVYKNGILLTGTTFNENTGVIELNTSVSDTDQLLITWQEETSDITQGAVAAAAGLNITFLPELYGDVSVTARIPVNQNNDFIQNGSQKNRFAALSTGLTFEKAGFKIIDKAAVSLLNDNTAEGLLIYCWQDLWDDYQKEKESSPDSKIQPPEKKASVSFYEQDFSPYNKISVEVEFINENQSTFTSPLILSFDQDTGTANKGEQAINLEIKNLSFITQKESTHTITILTDGSQVLFDDSALSENEYALTINSEIIPSRLTLKLSENSNLTQQAIIKKLTFNEAQNYGTVRNYTAAEYKKDGPLVQINDFALIKDLFISAESDQGSGNLAKPEPFVSAKSQGKITLSAVQFAGDAAIQNTLNSFDLSEAGHSVKTDDSVLLFKIISAQDSYRYKPSYSELRKENAFGLNLGPVKVPFKAGFKTSASKVLYSAKQNAEINAGYTQKIFDGEAGLNAKLTVSQKYIPADSFDYNYAEGWLNISDLEFSTGKEEAQNRNQLWSYSLNGTIPFNTKNNIITLKPKLTYELSDDYKINNSENENSPVITDKEFLQLLLPFTSDKKAISFEISRTGGGTTNTATGGDYKTDADKLYTLQNDRDWFYTSIPFYELFDQNLKNTITPASGYAAKYEGIFKRSLYNSIKDLYVPSSLSLALTREIKAQPPLSDLYQIKLVVTNNSVNNFGSNSSRKYFTWFKQEELSTSLTTIMKIPAEEPDNFKLNIQTYAQLLLFITDKSVITEQLDFAIDNSANWNARNTIAWSRPSPTSLITSLVYIVVPAAKSTDFAISRKDSLTVEVGKIEAELQQKYSYNHTLGIDFLEYYNVNAGLGGTLILNQKKANKINLNFSIGAKAEF